MNKRRFWFKLLIALFILIGIIVLLYWFLVGRFYESTEDAYVGGNLVKLMPKISGDVEAIYGDQTLWVKSGQVLVKLVAIDSKLALETAKDNLANTVRNVNQFYKNVEQARATVNEKQSELEKAKEDYQRRTKLSVSQTISQEELRHYKLSYITAQDLLIATQKQLEAEETLVQNTDLYHHPRVLAAGDQLRNAFLNWRRTLVYSPTTGYIAKRSVQVGQHVDPNTVLMMIVPMNDIWVDANFKETQLEHIRIGQPVTLTSDTYGRRQKFKGIVMGLTPGTGNVFDLLPPQNATGNWIKIMQRLTVRIKIIDLDKLKLYPLNIGLSMNVEVDTHDRKASRISQILQNKPLYETFDYSSDISEAEKLIQEIIRANADNVRVMQESNTIDKNADKMIDEKTDKNTDEKTDKNTDNNDELQTLKNNELQTLALLNIKK